MIVVFRICCWLDMWSLPYVLAVVFYILTVPVPVFEFMILSPFGTDFFLVGVALHVVYRFVSYCFTFYRYAVCLTTSCFGFYFCTSMLISRLVRFLVCSKNKRNQK